MLNLLGTVCIFTLDHNVSITNVNIKIKKLFTEHFHANDSRKGKNAKEEMQFVAEI